MDKSLVVPNSLFLTFLRLTHRGVCNGFTRPQVENLKIGNVLLETRDSNYGEYLTPECDCTEILRYDYASYAIMLPRNEYILMKCCYDPIST